MVDYLVDGPHANNFQELVHRLLEVVGMYNDGPLKVLVGPQLTTGGRWVETNDIG